MASQSSIVKELKKKNEAIKRRNTRDREERQRRDLSSLAVAGAALAAWIDSGWGEGEEAAEVMGVPLNAAIGGAGVLIGLTRPSLLPARGVTLPLSVGLACGATYKFMSARFEEDGGFFSPKG